MGEKITMTENGLRVPTNPVIPFIEGDGIGPDIWKAAQRVFDAAVEKAYGGERKVEWLEVLAGEKAFNLTGEWLPKETEKTIAEYLVGIKGPLTTPVGGGIRSLNVALRQLLDLYVCLRPVRYYAGIDTPVKHPEAVDMVIFRENTEDVYAGFETKMDEVKTAELIAALESIFGWKVKADSGIGIKPISRSGTERLVKAAIDYAIVHNRKSVTLVHKGNIMKFTEGAFRDIGYETAEKLVLRCSPVRRRSVAGNEESKDRRGYCHQRCDCRRFSAANSDAAGRVRCDSDNEFKRRLYFGCVGGSGWRNRNRAGGQYQLHNRHRGV